jgi:hypothetical protein
VHCTHTYLQKPPDDDDDDADAAADDFADHTCEMIYLEGSDPRSL